MFRYCSRATFVMNADDDMFVDMFALQSVLRRVFVLIVALFLIEGVTYVFVTVRTQDCSKVRVVINLS